MVRLAAAAALLACLSLASPAAAQRWRGPGAEPTEAELREARALYQSGTEAVEAHRWSAALTSFERSYALSGASVALYSLAYTLRVLGRYRDSRDAFAQLLDEHTDLEPEIREEAERLMNEVAAQIAVLRLAGLPEDPPPTILLDGAEVEDTGERPLPLESDPGERALRVEASGLEPFTWQGTLAPGDRVTVPVTLEEAGEPVTASPVFWIAVGISVIAAGVVVGAIAHQNAQLEPRTPFHVTL